MNHPLSKLYYGWEVHAGAFFCALLAAGCTSYIFGLFVVPVTGEFGISRANMNLGFTAYLLGFGVLSPLVGILVDKFSLRMIMVAGGVLFGVSYAVISRTDSLMLMLLMILIPVAFAMNANGPLGATTVVSRWFRRQRGKALSIVTVSTSVGGFIFIPLTAWLIENHGWRDALLIVGILVMIGIVLAALFLVKNRPTGNERGYDEEFAEPELRDPGPIPPEERTWRYKELLGNRNFWLLALGVGLLYGSDLALVTSQVPHFIDNGIELGAAAMIASFMTMSAIAGKLLVGALADRMDLRWIFHVIAIAHAVLLVVYMVMPPYVVLLTIATIMGIGVGGVFPIWATLIAWLFGSKSYGTIMGAMTVTGNLIGIIALRFIGRVHDDTGSYFSGFIVFFVLVMISMVLISLLRPRQNQPETTRSPPSTATTVQSAD